MAPPGPPGHDASGELLMSKLFTYYNGREGTGGKTGNEAICEENWCCPVSCSINLDLTNTVKIRPLFCILCNILLLPSVLNEFCFFKSLLLYIQVYLL